MEATYVVKNSKSSKKKKKAQTVEETRDRDCLTELPEPLLHNILSYLTMKDVIKTSVLSKRWRYIWLSITCLKFLPMKKQKYKEVGFINRTLLLHKGPKIQKFSITFVYNPAHAHQVDSWIHFAIARNVNELYLDFPCKRSCLFRYGYKLPHFIFSCRSLTVLALKHCVIRIPVNFIPSSLKILSLEHVFFIGGDISDLISSSPILEYLSLTNCLSSSDLYLSIFKVGMKTLKIYESHYYSQSSKLDVYAPFIVSFELVTNMSGKNYVMKKMQSLESASFDCIGTPGLQFNAEDKRQSIVQILDEVHHVKELRLCSCYILALSSGEGQDFITFAVTCLRIKTGLTKWELPGIDYMLKHSPNIETLIISIDKNEGEKPNDKSNYKFNFGDGEFWKLQEPNFLNLLGNLKTVKLYNFMSDLDVHTSTKTEELLEKLQNEMNFLRFLLKNSKVLEKLIITTCKGVDFGKSESKKLKLMFLLTQELLSFPRASRDAQISFS
ncbi:putative F-box protein At1g49610 [Camellia sinensis]|uniref:putative F-box protein At1g49610 n=1 Tax=Camellia sinensis TaxID=4442 RepID=UPI0010369B7F|nr:putative F-box protein At1g49610 [Camellia sinensis]